MVPLGEYEGNPEPLEGSRAFGLFSVLMDTPQVESSSPKRFTQRRRDRQIARLLAMGNSPAYVAKVLGCTAAAVTNRFNDAHFVALLHETEERYATAVDGHIIEALQEAEAEAVEVMRSLMTESKDDKVKLAAAESLLNRAGKRGKPVDTQQVATLDVNRERELKAALADPKVRERLEAAKKLALKAPKEEVIDVESTPA